MISLLAVTAFAWKTDVLDKNAAKSFFALCIDANNSPHVAYTRGYYRDSQYLMYASWNGYAWESQRVALEADALDLAIDSQNNPHILFSDNGKNYSNRGLRYASWTSSNWSIQLVASDGKPGCLALDSSGNPHVAYLGYDGLDYARWNGSEWIIQTVEPNENSSMPYGNPLSLAVDSSGNAHIMFENSPNPTSFETYQNIQYAVSDGSNWTIQTVYERATFGQMVLDSRGNPHFTYLRDNDLFGVLRYASWNGAGWDSQIVASNLTLDTCGSLALDSKGNPNIAFYDDSGNGALKFAKWTGTDWTVQTIDSNYALIGETQISIDSNGNPHICYDGHGTEVPTFSNAYLMYITSNQNQVIFGPNLVTFSILAFISLGVITAIILVKSKKQKHTPNIGHL